MITLTTDEHQQIVVTLPDLPAERPALGDIKPGDLVYVTSSMNDMRERPRDEYYTPARVTKAARVWITMVTENRWPRELRMRRDVQNEATQYSGSNAGFVTPEQRAYDETVSVVRRALNDNGIQVDRFGAWSGLQRQAALAAFIRAVTEKG